MYSLVPLLALGLLAALPATSQSLPAANKPAPELTGRTWLNTPGQEPIRLGDRKGKVTVVHFWTFACINCRRNLPIYDRWYEKFRERGVEVIGVHTPELPQEREWRNVMAETKKLGITYPVLFDPDYRNWNRWQQQFWPAIYLIDKKGIVRAAWPGELNYGNQRGEETFSRLIEALLAESGS